MESGCLPRVGRLLRVLRSPNPRHDPGETSGRLSRGLDLQRLLRFQRLLQFPAALVSGGSVAQPGSRVEEGTFHGADPVASPRPDALPCVSAAAKALRRVCILASRSSSVFSSRRLGGHGELGRAELVLAVMREDHVLDQDAELLGKGLKLADLLDQHALRDADVADELTLERVAEARLPRAAREPYRCRAESPRSREGRDRPRDRRVR